MNRSSNWRDRDWKWLVGILVGIMILMTASFFNSDKVEANFSIISSAVSVALALVAIFIALKQDSDNQIVTQKMSEALIKIEAKVNSMDGKIDNLDPNVITRPVEEKLIQEIKEIISDKEEGQDNSEKLEHIVKSVKNNFNEINNDLLFHYYQDDLVKVYQHKAYQHKVLIGAPNDNEIIRKFIREFENTFNISVVYSYSGGVLKIYYKENKLMKFEILNDFLNKYDGFYLIDMGIDGNI